MFVNLDSYHDTMAKAWRGLYKEEPQDKEKCAFWMPSCYRNPVKLLKTSLLSESKEATSTITDKARASREVSDL